MCKILMAMLCMLSAAVCFAQSQFLLDIVHNRSDFHIFRNDSEPADTMKFYNESSETSPVEFINYSNDEKIVTVSFRPFSYAETKYTKSSFDISELFGEITIETYSHGMPVRTAVSDGISVDNGLSKISFMLYPDNDIYIILHSGKISVSFRKHKLLMIAGETVVLRRDGSYQYLESFDYDLCLNRIISGIVSDRTAIFNEIRDRMSSFDDTSSVAYRHLWATRRFLEEY